MAANRMLWIVGRLALLEDIVDERWAKLGAVEEEAPKPLLPLFPCVCGRNFISRAGRSKHLNWTKGLCNKLNGHAVGADLGVGAAPVLSSNLNDVGTGGVLGVGGEGGGLVGGPDDPPAN